MKNKPVFYTCFWGILLGSFIYRLFIFFQSPLCIDSDNAIVGLMAKHILQGEFPIFFYGQPYMGGLEAFVASFFFLIFGISTFSLALSPIVFSLLFTISTYLLVAEFTKKNTALVAMAFIAFPPESLLVFGNIARGGYPATLLWGNLLFILTIRITKLPEKTKGKILLYACLGFIAGIAWWTNSLIIFYLLPITLYLLLYERSYLFGWNFLAGGICFFIGSLPFWIYNLSHHFASFQVPLICTYSHIKQALMKLFCYDLGRLFDLRFSSFFRIISDSILMFVYISACVFFLFSGFTCILRLCSRPHAANNEKALILFFVIAIILLYSVSHFALFGTQRYLLPLFSFIPIAIAWSLDNLPKKRVKAGIVLILFLIVVSTGINTTASVQWGKENREKCTSFLRFLEYLHTHNITRVLAPYKISEKINFLSNEGIIASSLHNEKYSPYQHAVEKAVSAAIAVKSKKLDKFLSTTGGTFNAHQIDKYRIYYDFRPMPYTTESILPTTWKAVSSHGTEQAQYAIDRRADTFWSSEIPKSSGISFTLDLGKKETFSRLRIFNGNHYNNFPEAFRLELSDDGISWRPLLASDGFTFCSWVGPRIYTWAENWHWDIGFPPKKSRFIRIIQERVNEQHSWQIKEIYVERFIAENPRMKDLDYWKDSSEKLLSFLLKKKLTFVYANRWLSALISDRTVEKIKTLLPKHSRTSLDEGYRSILHLSEETVLIVEKGYEKETRELLQECEIPFSTTEIAIYSCFFFTEPQAGPNLSSLGKSLYWTGKTLLRTNIKNTSMILYEKALLSLENKNPPQAQQLLQKALSYYPNNVAAHTLLASIFQQTGNTEKFLFHQKETQIRTTPRFPASVRFANGIECIGYSLDKETYKAGEAMTISYFWKQHRMLGQVIAVFVHFTGPGSIFQNDHTLLEQHPGQVFFEPFPDEVFRETYQLKIPEDTPPGDYSLGIGLFIPAEQKRIEIIHSDKKHKKNKAQLGTITIIK